MSISKMIYLLGKRLVIASENTWIQVYASARIFESLAGCRTSVISDTQKKQFFLIFQTIINMSKQRTLPNISLENAWQISFWLEILFRS